jgi:hypothetical protein
MSSPTLDAFRDEFARRAPPIVIFNKSHSGSRLLAEVVSSAGVFMGAEVNESWDSLAILPLVEYLVTEYYPDYSPLWDAARPADRRLARLIRDVFDRHLQGAEADRRPWGWKLCEAVYAVPVLDYCFPHARFVHLIRDGRDVAFCDHKAPDSAFWRKVYFNTDRIRTFGTLRLTPEAYRRQSYAFNALHWDNSVSIGRGFGAMLRERYVEVRYEDLCADLGLATSRLLDALGIDASGGGQRATVVAYGSSIGKYRAFPRRWLDRVVRIEKPLLLSLGYLDQDAEPSSRSPWRTHTADVVLDRWRRFSGRLL